MASNGQLTIRPLCAGLEHDVDLFMRMDPYCLITLGTQQWKSEVSKNGGKTPSWNDEVTFQLQPGVDLLRVALFDDKLLGPDKLIAEGVIPMEKLLNYASPFEEKIPLTYKAKPCGFIQFRFTISNFSQMLGQQNLGGVGYQAGFQNQGSNFQGQAAYQGAGLQGSGFQGQTFQSQVQPAVIQASGFQGQGYYENKELERERKEMARQNQGYTSNSGVAYNNLPQQNLTNQSLPPQAVSSSHIHSGQGMCNTCQQPIPADYYTNLQQQGIAFQGQEGHHHHHHHHNTATNNY